MAGYADYMLHFQIRLSSRGSGQTPKTHSDWSVLSLSQPQDQIDHGPGRK